MGTNFAERLQRVTVCGCPVIEGSNPQRLLVMWANFFPFVRTVIMCRPRRYRVDSTQVIENMIDIVVVDGAIFDLIGNECAIDLSIRTPPVLAAKAG